MKKPPLFQIQEDISIEQFAVLCILLGMCEADPGSHATTLRFMAATHYVDNAEWERGDLVHLAMNGFEGIDQGELDCGLPLRLAEEFRQWEWENQFQPLVQSVNEFIAWAWDSFIMWEN